MQGRATALRRTSRKKVSQGDSEWRADRRSRGCLIARPAGARQPPRLTQRFRRAAPATHIEDHHASGVGVDSPPGVDHHRPSARARPQPVADKLVPQSQLRRGASFSTWLSARRQQRPVCDSDRGQATDRAQVDRQTCATRMVPARRVGDQHVWRSSQRPHRVEEQPSLTQGEQPGRIRSIEATTNDHRLHHPVLHEHDGRSPGRVAGRCDCTPTTLAGGEDSTCSQDLVRVGAPG